MNLFVVWCLTGIWHGANITFVIWGLIYFIFLVFEKYCIKPEKRNFVVRVFWQIATLLLINFEWVIFNSGGLHSMVRYFRSMFGYYGNVSMDAYTYRMFHQYGFFVLLGILFSMPIAPRVSELLCRSSYGKRIVAVAVPIMYMSAFLWAISYLILGAHNPFIYFNF